MICKQKPKEVIALVKFPAKDAPYQTVAIRKPTRAKSQPAIVLPTSPPAKPKQTTAKPKKPTAKPKPTKPTAKPKPERKKTADKKKKKKKKKKKTKKNTNEKKDVIKTKSPVVKGAPASPVVKGAQAPAQSQNNKLVVVRLDKNQADGKTKPRVVAVVEKPTYGGRRRQQEDRPPIPPGLQELLAAQQPNNAILPPNPGKPLYERTLPADLTKNVILADSNSDNANSHNVVELANQVVKTPNIMAKASQQSESLHVNEKDLSDILSKVDNERAKSAKLPAAQPAKQAENPKDLKVPTELASAEVKPDKLQPQPQAQPAAADKKKAKANNKKDDQVVVELEVTDEQTTNNTKAVVSIAKTPGKGSQDTNMPFIIGEINNAHVHV